MNKLKQTIRKFLLLPASRSVLAIIFFIYLPILYIIQLSSLPRFVPLYEFFLYSIPVLWIFSVTVWCIKPERSKNSLVSFMVLISSYLSIYLATMLYYFTQLQISKGISFLGSLLDAFVEGVIQITVYSGHIHVALLIVALLYSVSSTAYNKSLNQDAPRRRSC